MAIRRRSPRGGLVTTKIPINNINSVATQAANKRQPNEADQIDNCMVSLERGLEKRSGFEVVPQNTIAGLTQWDFANSNTKFDLFTLSELANSDLFYYWYSINDDNTFLVAVDFKASGATDKLFYIYKLNSDGSWVNQTPATQWDTSISTSNGTVQAYASANGISNAAAAALGVVSASSRAYLTYGNASKSAKDSLKAISLGANVIILNTNVSAGFSSDTDGKLYGLDGIKTNTDDVAGRPVVYYTAAKIMKVYDAGDDTINSTSDDVLLGWKPGITTGKVASGAANYVTLAQSASNLDGAYAGLSITVYNASGAVVGTRTITTYTGSSRIAYISSAFPTTPAAGFTYSIEMPSAAYMPVADYFYYDSTKKYLGQKVDDLSEIRLPPDNNDLISNNSNLTPNPDETTARDMLRVLHDADTKYSSLIDGRGKVYFCVNPYLGATSGYYRVISFPEGQTLTENSVTYNGAGRPYLQKVRTPDEHSYIDPKRMPQRLKVTIQNGGVISWAVEPVKWTPRTSGTKDSNPGPSIFKTVDGKELRQVQIKSIAVFKDRLWFAADDVVFSSQMGDYENLFMSDPANMITTDPIDIRVSSNNYAEISSMVPFEEYIFIDTKASTQFQLTAASSSELSPTNVAVAPVTYYGTAPIATPQLIGSRLYFFGPQRLYLFVGKNAMGYSSAVEVSASAAGYLPVTYGAICTAPAQDTIAMVDADNPNRIYMYTSRFSGDRVIQNSFYRYVAKTSTEFVSIQSFKNYLYAVAKDDNKIFLMRTKLINEALDVPRLDNMVKLKLIPKSLQATNWNVDYDTATGITTFRLPFLGHPEGNGVSNPTVCRVVLDSSWGNSAYTVLTPLAKNAEGGTHLLLEVSGNYEPASGDTKYAYFGVSFEMRVQLSTVFVRDENNNIIDGVLNIRNGVFRHYNTGIYKIEVTHRGRTPLVSQFTAPRVDFTQNEDTIPLEAVETQGEFVAKIFGYSDTTKISIVSDDPTPVNITNIELKGKFKQKYTTLS